VRGTASCGPSPGETSRLAKAAAGAALRDAPRTRADEALRRPRFCIAVVPAGTVLHISVNNSRFYGCELVKSALPRGPGRNASYRVRQLAPLARAILLAITRGEYLPSLPGARIPRGGSKRAVNPPAGDGGSPNSALLFRPGWTCTSATDRR